MEREGNQFIQRICIPCYDTDASFYLKPAAFMDMAQEIAYWAAQALGFGYDDLQKHRTAWVLSRMHFHFADPPKWRDEVSLRTWHKGTDGLFFLRDFELRGKDGALLVSATSSWLVIDVETRHLVRSDQLDGLLSAETAEPVDAIAEPAPKIPVPRNLETVPAGTHRVAYSDVDIIGHTNNARYLVWAMDCLDYGEAAGRRVRDVFLNFNRETVPGEEVELSISRDGGDVFYVEGRVAGKSAFTAKLVY